MTRMWQGASPALKAAESDPLWAAVHRHNGRNWIASEFSQTGLSATVYRTWRGGCEQIGRVEGDNPLSVAFKIAHQFTPFGSDLLALHASYIEREAEHIGFDCRQLLKRLDGQLDELAEVLAYV